jgi:hypothetical protein
VQAIQPIFGWKAAEQIRQSAAATISGTEGAAGTRSLTVNGSHSVITVLQTVTTLCVWIIATSLFVCKQTTKRILASLLRRQAPAKKGRSRHLGDDDDER